MKMRNCRTSSIPSPILSRRRMKMRTKMALGAALTTKRRTTTRTDPGPAVWTGMAQGSPGYRQGFTLSRQLLPTTGRTHLRSLRLHAECGSGPPRRPRGELRAGKPDLELPGVQHAAGSRFQTHADGPQNPPVQSGRGSQELGAVA